ncbi:MAG TPA: class I SAM-dependent methyltransferase [Allosphingosinicella sp.]|jgi:hypothetical protein
MSDLLIHSMSEFSDLILKSLDIAEAATIAEIGAEFGGMSQRLADFAAAHGGSLTSVDPAPKPEFLRWAATCPHVRHIAATSLETIPDLKGIRAWVIDGDHNYYTVFHELKGIAALGDAQGIPLLAFLHDVSWPSARRDMYYAPDQIPADWLHPHDYDSGAILESRTLQPYQGFRGMGSFAMAIEEGGPRNGVLTAVEDFMSEAGKEGHNLVYAHVPAVFGLGILFDSDAPWAAELAQHVAPYHNNTLLGTLEANRLRNYLKVLELQDGVAPRISRAA